MLACGDEDTQPVGIAGPSASTPAATSDETVRRPPAGRREREKEQRLAARGDRILDALAALIARWGYGKTTVDDVAREAGVAKGTVYLHWPTKGAMLHALIEREERQWNAVIAERMAADPRGGTLSSLYRHTLALCMESPLLRALFIQDHDALGEWTRSPQSRVRSRYRMEALYALIRALRAAGVLRTDLTVEVQAYLLAALTYGILAIEEYVPADFMPPEADVLNGFATLMRRGLETEAADTGDTRTLARGQTAIADLMARLAAMAAASGQAAEQAGPAPLAGSEQNADDTGDREDTI